MKQVRGVWLPAGDEHMASEIARTPVVAGRPTYQYGKLLAAMEHVRSRRLAVDVGGHVGLWAFQLAQLFERVLVFEPIPRHLACLRKNLAGLAGVSIQPFALGTRSGQTLMQAATGNSGESHVAGEATRTGLRAELRRLDDYNLADVGFIKLDCEGYEYFALHGARETIERCRPVVVVEQHEPSAVRYGIPHLAGRDLLVRRGYVEVAQLTVDHVMVPKEFLSC